MARKSKKPVKVQKTKINARLAKRALKKLPIKRLTKREKEAMNRVHNRTVRSVDKLALVRGAPSHLNKDAPPQYVQTKTQTWSIAAQGIPGLIEGELEAILEREGVKHTYENWREAKATAQALSMVGGIVSATIVTTTVKTTITRSEVWTNGQCTSTDGGVTKLVRRERE